jgi:DNA-binding transcriptional MerR regulator
MDTTQIFFTIQEAAEKTGLTVHTLRYYERIGLLMPIGRAANGHRRYSQQDINFIGTLYCWLQTGMPLDDIQLYVKLLQQGDETVAERRALLENNRQIIVSQIEQLQATLQVIDYKIQNYADIEQKLEQIEELA